MWVVEREAVHSQAVAHGLEDGGECAVSVEAGEGKLEALLATVDRQW